VENGERRTVRSPARHANLYVHVHTHTHTHYRSLFNLFAIFLHRLCRGSAAPLPQLCPSSAAALAMIVRSSRWSRVNDCQKIKKNTHRIRRCCFFDFCSAQTELSVQKETHTQTYPRSCVSVCVCEDIQVPLWFFQQPLFKTSLTPASLSYAVAHFFVGVCDHIGTIYIWYIFIYKVYILYVFILRFIRCMETVSPAF